MAIEMTAGTTAGIAACTCYRTMSVRFGRLLTWAAAGVPPQDRQLRPEDPEPAQGPRPQGDQAVSAPGPGISMYAAYARNDHARQMVAGFAASTPALSEAWRQVDRALADVPALGAVIARLTADLAGARLDRANLMAAMRAALAAHAEGESDPLSYLSEELGELDVPPLPATSQGRRP